MMNELHGGHYEPAIDPVAVQAIDPPPPERDELADCKLAIRRYRQGLVVLVVVQILQAVTIIVLSR